ncbi:MAG: transcriptional regulator [Vicinamibacterales bacterium]
MSDLADPSADSSMMRDFKVGGWLVQPRLCRMSRNGSEVRLRPQIVDLLCTLASHHGEVALKSELMREVWPGRYVAETALARCVAELRQALEDNAHEPRYIETIPKRGYRLIAGVEFAERAQPDVAASSVPGEPAEELSSPARADRTMRWLVLTGLLLLAALLAAALAARGEADPAFFGPLSKGAGAISPIGSPVYPL